MIGMTVAFGGASSAEGKAIGQLRFEKLAVAGFVGARHDIACGIAHGGAVKIEPDASHEIGNVAL